MTEPRNAGNAGAKQRSAPGSHPGSHPESHPESHLESPAAAGASDAPPGGVDEPLASAEVSLLAEVGFLASAVGDVERAGTIFTALMALRPRRAFPHIGLALAWLNAGKPAEAVAVFECAPPVDAAELPDLAIYHALALQLASRLGESQRVLAGIDRTAASPVVVRLARGMDGGADPASGPVRRDVVAGAGDPAWAPASTSTSTSTSVRVA